MGNILTRLFESPVSYLILGIGIYVWVLIRHDRYSQAAQPNARKVMARDTRKPVLYLRPFKTDVDQFRVGVGRGRDDVRAEPLLLEPFQILGPMVAIGRPKDHMPPWGGAARLYTGDDWQSTFRELLDQAQLAILFAGTTVNFQWEVGQVFNHEPFVPTVLLVPVTGQQWISFRSTFTTATGIELPEAANKARLIYFPARNQPIPFADPGDEDDRLLTVDNPYLGALVRLVDLIQPGSAAPWIEKAHESKSAKTFGMVIGALITALIVVMKACSGF